ncbi:GNAT family N-acetyltransferase [Flagellimonas sp. CMM7]|uniref:GNAT family N-acetyltransferase n=1 Tax=Flagellimonas sp. CMM7 TaxID=2654676 RepID=UPI0013CF8D86|nr:GNAT family N-acetyltransferase [Flagellimonas sp. CMM7]UII79915.1 GNAT family N-acetyltransferase [Flagellimonas sp. CMM7]
MEDITIREAKKSDAPEIVELLKVALGVGTEKSVANWYWKHYENPFGQSKIYVAVIDTEIVGVRAFMQWKWVEKDSGKVLKAVRAVDTAVSPNHRRKGIFLTLTNHALQKVKEEKFDFVFNTPNNKSIGGYLKLGWVLNRKIPVNLIVNPLFWLSNKRKLEKFSSDTLKLIEDNEIKFQYPFKESMLTCPFTTEYFVWRYVNNPLASYKYLHTANGVLVIYRIKKTKKVVECRVVDIQLMNSNASKYVKNALSILIKRYSVVSFVKGIVSSKLILGKFFLAANLNRQGPNMVTKNVNLSDERYNNILDTNSTYWGYSLGDMELF